MIKKSISSATLKRLPLYLNYLKGITNDNSVYISSAIISEAMKLNEIQVRKDLASVSDGGKPKVGYNIQSLIFDIEDYLGFNNSTDAIIIGAGKMGKALMEYEGFSEYGVNIIAAFDNDSSVIDEKRKIYSIDKVKNLCDRLQIKIGIITVPSDSAQEACDILIDSGIRAIWNFTHVHLNVPDSVIVQSENLAVSFALLSQHLKEEII